MFLPFAMVSPPFTAPESYRILCLADVGRLKTCRPARDIELDAVTLGEALESRGLDGAEVHEHVLAALLRDEPKTLGVVEPLDLSCCHYCISFGGAMPRCTPADIGGVCLGSLPDKEKRRANWISRGVSLGPTKLVSSEVANVF